jgi:iduronate 2-sulfatase
MSRREFLRFTGALAGAACIAQADATAQTKPNVLFIAVDDLRPMLGCYGDEVAVTPHIDALAARGMVFERAYCQIAVCNPSRASLLTGRRPDTIQVWDLEAHFRDTLPNVVTLPQCFKEQGYHVQAIGKILHGNGRPAKDPPSWSAEPLHDDTRAEEFRYALPENLEGEGLKRNSTEIADVPDNRYIDGVVCDDAIEALRAYTGTQTPFFLGVGFRKPHLPFCAPQKYWDLYERAAIPTPVEPQHPDGAPEFAVRSWRELEGYKDIPSDGLLGPQKVAELRHGYYACVSYIDAQVGRLLAELERLGLAENTVVMLWGDHGFHLGEQGLWAKANNFELSTRAPLLLAVPGKTDNGEHCPALVEFVDIYPTLAELCGVQPPPGIEGISMLPLLSTPNRPWKQAAFSQYPRDKTKNRHSGHGDVMGYTVRTKRHRYVEWRDWESGEVLARELYDHESDAAESKNLANNPEYAGTLTTLAEVLAKGWRGALPLEISTYKER